MKIIDLTHTIQAEMPVYPGTEQPIFQAANSLEEHGFAEKKITMFSHTGTHIDAPSHLLKEGQSLDSYSVDHFTGKAFIINLEGISNREIHLHHVKNYEKELSDVDYLLFNTGWSKLWGRKEFFSGYPVLTEEAALWLSENFSFKGIGTDAISVDDEASFSLPIHNIFLRKGLIVIENLNSLDRVQSQKFQFFCLPLKTKDADGAPARAIAVLGDCKC